uniref:Immunoglobulin domain-containing protein n=1 Tax=Oryctolagus cuniculus TaxID=9986 RepID=A0A5F9C1R8_RABIT
PRPSLRAEVLACKGTGSWDPASGFLPGTLPRPSLWAEPGSVIALGRPGALWCGGPWRPRSAICIGRESQSPGTERCPWSPETRPIPHTLMAEVYAGRYCCVCLSAAGWSEPSAALELGSDSLPGTLPKPSIWADPGPLVAVGSAVTLWCQGSLQAEIYRVYKEGSPLPWEMRTHSQDTGQYWCVGCPCPERLQLTERSQVGARGGTPPDMPLPSPAEMFPAPSRSAQPSLVVASGGNVSLSCRSEYDDARTAHLLKEGGAGPLHAQGSHGAVPAEFPVGPVTSAHTGTYRCFGTYSAHVWSFPSEPVKLLVTGEEAPSSQVLPGGPSAPAPAAWDHTAQNLLRIGLAVLVLVALTWLLAEDWLCRWRTREGARRAQAAMDCDVWAVPQSGVTCTEWGAGVEVTAC